MARYIITYDLKNPSMSYNDFFETIKDIGDWQNPLENVWVVDTDMVSAGLIAQRLSPYFDKATDRLFIAEVSPKNVQGWLGTKFWQWFNNDSKR